MLFSQSHAVYLLSNRSKAFQGLPPPWLLRGTYNTWLGFVNLIDSFYG